VTIGGLVPALPPCILEPLWDQFAALLPVRPDIHPLGCHRRRIPDRVLFDKLVQVLVFGCGYRRIADHTCSATTLRRRRDEWIALGLAERVRLAVLAAYDRMLGLELAHLAVDRPRPARGRDPAPPGQTTAPGWSCRSRPRRRPYDRAKPPTSLAQRALQLAKLSIALKQAPLHERD
jgi:hypothetical protein